MKKINLLFLFLSISLLTFNGCDSDDQSDAVFNTIISAGQYEFDLGVTVNTSSSIDINVYTNDISSVARTFNILVSEESTGSASDYTVPSSITIPANANKAVLTIDSVDETNTLVLEIEEKPGVFAAEKIVVNIIKVCPYNLDNFVGTYDALEDGQYTYEVTVQKGTGDQLILTNVYGTGGTTVLDVDASNPDNPTVSFPTFGNGGVLYVHSTYGDVYAVNPSAFGDYSDGSSDTSAIDLCESSISLAFVRQVSIGIFSNIINVELTKK
ncbi:hypothetical protein [Wocania ichthyoenteri]|uniref:hypothetical protein n=1 Tax=Wocania ichthyoenteri TaxID=1230531 RepID=UPI00053ECF20|nr:hypothetical protein [Wocania ichthyoenteri]